MKQVLAAFVFIFLSLRASGQSINRIDVNGVILSSNNDVEAVTIYNTSSNKGTITNIKGEFVIKVALHDVVEISALQFQTVSVTIDDEVIESKQLKIHLVEQVNRLDAVTLSSGLSGNILVDVSNVKTVTPIRIGMGNMNVDFEYNDEKDFYKKAAGYHYKSIINPDDRNYQPDPLKILKLLFKVDVPTKINLFTEKKVYDKPKYLLDVYNHKYISETFNVPLESIEAFVVFVEEKGVDSKFLKSENEILLIEFLIKQSELFLKLRDDKN